MVEQVAKYLFDWEEGVLQKYWASDGGGAKKLGLQQQGSVFVQQNIDGQKFGIMDYYHEYTDEQKK